jgi:hypothetical protein
VSVREEDSLIQYCIKCHGFLLATSKGIFQGNKIKIYYNFHNKVIFWAQKYSKLCHLSKNIEAQFVNPPPQIVFLLGGPECTHL